MKILNLKISGISMIKKEIEIDFFAEQRVKDTYDNMASNLFNNIFINNIISIVGKNASGKTSILKLLRVVFSILNGKSLNDIEDIDMFFRTRNNDLEIVFSDGKDYIYKLESKISLEKIYTLENRYKFEKETIYCKKINKTINRKNMLNFEKVEKVINRDGKEQYLQNDVSIITSITNNKKIIFMDLINSTNMNLLRYIGDIPKEILSFLDSNIEYIKFNEETNDALLKFNNKKEIYLNNLLQFEKYLSSGTVKGINIFVVMKYILKEGGYLIIDEIENHFNREIVNTLIRFFVDKNINKNRSTLIFSTHYSELIDEFTRTDNIYITSNENGIEVQKLNNKIKRNDVKKSELFKTGYIKEAAVQYEEYMNLKKFFKDKMNGE